MDNLLTVQEACKALGISRATLYRLKDAGKIPTVKVGGSRRISMSALQKIMDSGTERKREAS